MREKKVTFAEIAAYTHFSKATISRYFNHPDYLTEENRKIIQDALIALNYHENKIGRILAKGETELIGIILPSMSVPFFSDVFQEILNRYSDSGYKFVVFSGTRDAATEKSYIEELLAYRIDGLIVFSHTLESSYLDSLDIPVVTVEREDQHVSSVNTDNLLGGTQAASYLYKTGCESLFFIDGNTDSLRPAYGRFLGFRQICQYENLDYTIYMQDMGRSRDAEYDAICKIIDAIELRHAERRVGIFAANDIYAAMVQKYYYQRYGILGDHYQLIGFDNSRVAKESIIPFSSVGQQVDRLAEETMDILVRAIHQKQENPDEKPAIEHRTIPPVMVVRNSPRS